MSQKPLVSGAEWPMVRPDGDSDLQNGADMPHKACRTALWSGSASFEDANMFRQRTPTGALKSKTSLLLLDPHGPSRDALAANFVRHADFELLGSTGDVEKAVVWATILKPRLVLVDLHQLANAESIYKRLRCASETSKLVCMTPYFRPEDLPRAASLGADAVLIKGIPFAQTVDVLRPLMV